MLMAVKLVTFSHCLFGRLLLDRGQEQNFCWQARRQSRTEAQQLVRKRTQQLTFIRADIN